MSPSLEKFSKKVIKNLFTILHNGFLPYFNLIIAILSLDVSTRLFTNGTGDFFFSFYKTTVHVQVHLVVTDSPPKMSHSNTRGRHKHVSSRQKGPSAQGSRG